MKKKVILLIGILFVATGLSLAAQDKEYSPLTTWPFYYEDFQTGWITTYQGGKINYDQININVSNGKLNYIQNGTVMEANMGTVALLNIGQDAFVCASGKMVKVLRNTLHGAVVLSTSVDADAMGKANIGYGSSSIASTQNVSAGALGTGLGFDINKSLDTASRDKDSGEVLALQKITGIYYKGRFYPATKTDILNIPGIDKDAVKNYIKSEKIKFSDIDDLAKLVDFLYSLQ